MRSMRANRIDRIDVGGSRLDRRMTPGGFEPPTTATSTLRLFQLGHGIRLTNANGPGRIRTADVSSWVTRLQRACFNRLHTGPCCDGSRGSRTRTARFLRPLPLPIGLRSRDVEFTPVGPARTNGAGRSRTCTGAILNRAPLPIGLQRQQLLSEGNLLKNKAKTKRPAHLGRPLVKAWE